MNSNTQFCATKTIWLHASSYSEGVPWTGSKLDSCNSKKTN